MQNKSKVIAGYILTHKQKKKKFTMHFKLLCLHKKLKDKDSHNTMYNTIENQNLKT